MPIKIKAQRLFESTFTLSAQTPDLPLPPDLDQAALGGFFVTLPIGKVDSESRNDRRYPRAAMESMVNTLNIDRPLGWWGHSDESYRSTQPPIVKWLAAKIESDGMVYGKLVPLTADARRYFEIAVATGARVGNSLYGEGEMGEDGHTVQNLRVHHIDMLAVDSWVGVPETSGRPSITSESVNLDREKESGKMSYTEAEITAFAANSTRLTTLEAKAKTAFGGATLEEALENAAKAVDKATMSHLGSYVEQKVTIPAMRPIVIKMITDKPNSPEAAEKAVDALLASPEVAEAMKNMSTGSFGGGFTGEAADVNRGGKDGGASVGWREAAIKNARTNAKKLGITDRGQ